MTDSASISQRQFRRNSDRAMLGGVCAGFADYFGLNLRITRILTAVGFLAMPMTILAYIAIVFLIPAGSSNGRASKVDADFRRGLRSSPSQTMSDVRGRFQSLDRRLARLEKHVTSSRYQLDKELSEL
jgi:phage shock protein C